MLRKGKKTASQSGTVRGSRKEAVGGDPLSWLWDARAAAGKATRGRRFNSPILLNDFPYTFCQCSQFWEDKSVREEDELNGESLRGWEVRVEWIVKPKIDDDDKPRCDSTYFVRNYFLPCWERSFINHLLPQAWVETLEESIVDLNEPIFKLRNSLKNGLCVRKHYWVKSKFKKIFPPTPKFLIIKKNRPNASFRAEACSDSPWPPALVGEGMRGLCRNPGMSIGQDRAQGLMSLPPPHFLLSCTRINQELLKFNALKNSFIWWESFQHNSANAYWVFSMEDG